MTVATVLPPAVCLSTADGLTTEGKLLAEACRRHGQIEPCSGREWAECFATIAGRRVLWYNDQSGNTHMAIEVVAQ